MILGALRLFKSLSGYHYRTIIVTMLIPVIGAPMIDYLGPDRLVFQVILYLTAFLVWSMFAVLTVAHMLNKDRSEAEHMLTQQIEALSGQISKLEVGQEDLGTDLRQQVKDIEETVRTTLKESLGIVLPARPISLRAKFTGGSSKGSASGAVVGGRMLTRLRQWLRRTMRRL